MPIRSTDAKKWLARVAPGRSIADVAKGAGHTPATLQGQLVRGRVAEPLITAIARSLALDPLEELRSFATFSELRAEFPEPREALALIDWPAFFYGVSQIARDEPLSDRELGPVVYPDSGRVWADAIDPGNIRGAVANMLGVSLSNVVQGFRRPALRVDFALAFAEVAGTPQMTALVVADVLTPIEAGWRPNERVHALTSTPMSDLLEIVQTRAHTAEKLLRRLERFEEELG